MLTLKEAAATCGYSDKTLRNRIKAGTLKAHQVVGKYGPEWMVTEEALETAGFTPRKGQETPGPGFHGFFEGYEDDAPGAAEDMTSIAQATSVIMSQQEQIGYYKAKTETLEIALDDLRNASKQLTGVYEQHLETLRQERDRAMGERDAIIEAKMAEIQEWKRELAVAREPRGLLSWLRRR